MPNNKDDAPNPSSEDNPNPTEGNPSSGDNPSGEPTGEGKQDTDTLENLASRQVQGLMDRSQALMAEGRYSELSPKVIQLLTTYDRLTQTQGQAASGGGDAAGGGNPGLTAEGAPDPRKSYDQLGRESEQKAVLTKISAQVETDVVKSMWAEDVRSLYAELGKTQVTTEDFSSVDFTDQKRFPPTRVGYAAWTKAAGALRVKMALSKGKGSTESGEDEDGDSSGLDADRENAGKFKKQPQPASAGAALTDIGKATQRKKEGKLTGPEYLEIVRKGTSSGILE